MRIRQFGKWNTSTPEIIAPDAKSNQKVAIQFGSLIIEMEEEEALELANNLADFIEAA